MNKCSDNTSVIWSIWPKSWRVLDNTDFKCLDWFFRSIYFIASLLLSLASVTSVNIDIWLSELVSIDLLLPWICWRICRYSSGMLSSVKTSSYTSYTPKPCKIISISEKMIANSISCLPSTWLMQAASSYVILFTPSWNNLLKKMSIGITLTFYWPSYSGIT